MLPCSLLCIFHVNSLPPILFCITKRHGDVQAPSSVQSTSSYYRSLTHSDQRTAGYTDHLLVCSMVWFLSPKEGSPLQTKTRTVKSKPVLALQGSLKWPLQKNGATSNKFGRCKKLKKGSVLIISKRSSSIVPEQHGVKHCYSDHPGIHR